MGLSGLEQKADAPRRFSRVNQNLFSELTICAGSTVMILVFSGFLVDGSLLD